MSAYQNIRHQIENLTLNEQLNLLMELGVLLRRQTLPDSDRRSILELEGLGKEIWQGIEAQSYVNQERDSWNG
ncbi:MAG: hypothetical protein HC772_13915 [Leptolyngbyaceae cyanobacterium CRU_2_3]|nr:hypothetical protein [Leptolyngbyaceae cyanobacterium CRU_2_3]